MRSSYKEIQFHQVGLDCPCNILPRTLVFRGACVQYCTHPCGHLFCCHSPKNLLSHISECSQVKHRSSTHFKFQLCATQNWCCFWIHSCQSLCTHMYTALIKLLSIAERICNSDYLFMEKQKLSIFKGRSIFRDQQILQESQRKKKEFNWQKSHENI